MDIMSEEAQDTVDAAAGWIFAFEGGAHVLFRYGGRKPNFVNTGDQTSLKLERKAIEIDKEESAFSINLQKLSFTGR